MNSTLSIQSTIPASEAQVNLPKVLNMVVKKMHTVAISLTNNKKVVVMPAEEYDSWMETIDVLNDKQLMNDLKQSQKEIHKGLLVSESDAEKYLAK